MNGKITYTMNEIEYKKQVKFQNKHADCKGACSLIFTPTGIGSNIKIMCNSCGKVKDITDYTSW